MPDPSAAELAPLLSSQSEMGAGRFFPVASWFAVLGIVLIVYGMRQFYRSEYTLWEMCLYVPTFIVGRLQWRVHFTNDPPPELSSGALLVANHRSSVDPFFVQLAARRRVHWMVAKEFCDHFLFGRLLKLLQVIPTNRSGMDTASTKAAIRITREGRLVGMFPEGRINLGKTTLLPLRSGAAVVALRANVPLIPLLIEGSPYRDTVWSPILMPARVRITFGQAIQPPQASAGAYAAEVPTSGAKGSPYENQESEKGTSANWDRVESNLEADPDSASPVRLDEADQIMLKWGRQIVELAGHPTCPVELSAARTRRGRTKSAATNFCNTPQNEKGSL